MIYFIILPTRDCKGRLLAESYVDEMRAGTMASIASEFGGCSAFPGVGMWTNGTGDVIQEEVLRVETCVSGAAGPAMEWFRNLAKELEIHANQASVAWGRYPGEMQFT